MCTLTRGQVGDKAHPAVEHHVDVHLAFALGDFDHLHQAGRAATGDLRGGYANAEGSEQQAEEEPVPPTLNAGTSHPILGDAVRADSL